MATTRSALPPRDEEHEETDAQKAARAQREEKAVRDEAEKATAHLPAPGTPAGAIHHLTGADVAEKGEKMVRMLFSHQVTITLPGYRMVTFPAGLQDVPESMADTYAEDFANANAVPAR